MVIGSGASTLFWEDRWLDGKSIREIVPEVCALIPKHRRRQRKVQKALLERSWITDIVGASALCTFRCTPAAFRDQRP
jgi:hypothetical protein